MWELPHKAMAQVYQILLLQSKMYTNVSASHTFI